MPLSIGTLWIVATPIGNCGDLSPRSREILCAVDLVLAEDTRRAAQLFREVGINCKKLLSFFEHNEQERQPEVLAALAAGQDVALIADAGTPLLSDPGFRLVQACRAKGLRVSPVPGPCAAVAALSAAGIAPLPFAFLGFLPRGERARKEIFAKFGQATLVFFERKDRLAESLGLAFAVLGNRACVVCRELTKQWEEFRSGFLATAAELCADLLGELTIIIGPPQEVARTDLEKVRRLLIAAVNSGLKPRQAARMVKEQVSGYSVAELYGLCVNRGSDSVKQVEK